MSSCQHIEALLPVFVEGDLSETDAAVVRAHVESCAACREALATFSVMEKALVSRRSEIPALEAFLPDLAALRARRYQEAEPRPVLTRVFRTMMSVPGVSILLMMWGAMFAFSFRTSVADDVARWSSLARWEALMHAISGFFVGLTGADAWVLTGVYVAVAIVILASGATMTLRYIRH